MNNNRKESLGKMRFKMVHENYNVNDLQKSMDFYEKALDLKEIRRITSKDGSFIIVYLGNGETDFELELTWLKDREKPYDLGECEFHLAFQVDDYDAAHAKHQAMGCICYENSEMGIYFISDPNGYWLEIIPEK
ncbi:MAG: VOC family protein [Desulfobacteraceae bacterium]|jgi:lactoylglutathione lyase